MRPTLYPFQQETVDFLVHALNNYGGALCASEVGTGKTPVAIETMRRLDCKAMLIVVPKSILLQWRQEFGHFDYDVKVFVIQGTKDERLAIYQAAKLIINKGERLAIIIGYETLRVDWRDLQAI